MCQPFSWIEYDGKHFIITDAELKSERGKELLKECGSPDDIWGHGFCRQFYNLKSSWGREHEISNPWSSEFDAYPEVKKIVQDLRKNFSYMFSLSGSLDLSGLTTLPENVKFPEKVGGSLDLRGLTTLPENVKFPEKCGSLDLSGLTEKDRKRALGMMGRSA